MTKHTPQTEPAACIQELDLWQPDASDPFDSPAFEGFPVVQVTGEIRAPPSDSP